MLEKKSENAAGVRGLPQVQRLLEMSQAGLVARQAPRPVLVAALRAVLDQARADLLRAAPDAVPPPAEELLRRAECAIVAAGAPVLRRAINATGIVLHTNLGRAPLSEAALAAVMDVSGGYSNLEFDLGSGERGSRMQGIAPLLCELTGAEAALAVNNAAAAVLLALSGLAGGGEVIVSRGELVEIGGGFRVPDVIRQGGARLVEVGTTNKTRLADYRDAITPQTRMLLKVHQSNYRIVGFTAEASLPELASLARAHDLLLMQDLGSGALLDLRHLGRAHEPTVRDSLAAGADLVAFSGDKLLGGPQAGLLVGQRRAVDLLRRHPLLRALRLDKMSLAALEATLRLYRDPAKAATEIPILRMLGQDEALLQARAERLCALLGDRAECRIEASTGYAGGGTLPDSAIPSRAVAVQTALPAEEFSRRLRASRPAVVGRLGSRRLLLDMLTVDDAELAAVAAAIGDAVAA